MATKIQQILKSNPNMTVAFGNWLSQQGLDKKSQYAYTKSGWLHRLSKGVYKVRGTTPTLFQTIAAYNNQLGKQCVVGAYTALEMRGYSHYLSMGKPKAYLYVNSSNRLPQWMMNEEWDMTIKAVTTSFLGDDLKGVETMVIGTDTLLVSSPERATLECLNLSDASSNLLDIYYVMESLTTLRPRLLQSLLEGCTSQKVKRLFLYMAEKANHPWYKSLNTGNIGLGSYRQMIVPKGKYIRKYNMTIPTELAEYE